MIFHFRDNVYNVFFEKFYLSRKYIRNLFNTLFNKTNNQDINIFIFFQRAKFKLKLNFLWKILLK